MDEPAAGLPEAEVPDFAARRSDGADEHGAGVLLVDHNVALVIEVCDRIHVLDQGADARGGDAGRDPRRTSTSRLRISARAPVHARQ